MVRVTLSVIALKAMAALRTSSGPSSGTGGAVPPRAAMEAADANADNGRATRRAMKAAAADATTIAMIAAMTTSVGQPGAGGRKNVAINWLPRTMGTVNRTRARLAVRTAFSVVRRHQYGHVYENRQLRLL